MVVAVNDEAEVSRKEQDCALRFKQSQITARAPYISAAVGRLAGLALLSHSPSYSLLADPARLPHSFPRNGGPHTTDTLSILTTTHAPAFSSCGPHLTTTSARNSRSLTRWHRRHMAPLATRK